VPYAGLSGSVSAQGESRGAVPFAVGDRIYCGGYISDEKPNGDIRIVGNPRQVSVQYLTNGDRAFINKGQDAGIQVGDKYQVIRPLGSFYHPFKNLKHRFLSTDKRGDKIGYYTEEVGFARVLAVQEKTSTIEFTEACSDIHLGDALVKFEKPVPPEQKPFKPLDTLSLANGKLTGQIIFARGSREQLGASDVVAIDLGQKAGVKVGDYFTIYRPVDSEHITKFRDDEVASNHIEGGSDRFRGNDRSILYPSIKREKIEKQYPPKKVFPRTVVGELVVTRVEGNTASAVITRTQGGEAFLGDNVELQ
jgi:hypothetical protein